MNDQTADEVNDFMSKSTTPYSMEQRTNLFQEVHARKLAEVQNEIKKKGFIVMDNSPSRLEYTKPNGQAATVPLVNVLTDKGHAYRVPVLLGNQRVYYNIAPEEISRQIENIKRNLRETAEDTKGQYFLKLKVIKG